MSIISMRRVLTLLLCLGMVPGLARAQTLSDVETAIVEAVDALYDASVDFVARTVAVNSGTFNAAGVREVGAIYDEAFREIGLETSWIAYPDSVGRAGHLFARTRGTEGRRLLLIGHLDTVFEPDSPFQTFRRDGDRAYGPGVVDMKGGNAVILFALRALRDAGVLHDAAITVALTGDEENPGPVDVVRRELIDEARAADVALGFEGSSPRSATVARRGVSRWILEVDARTGHSSQVFSEAQGYGAIYEAARILDAFRRALSGETYLTFNAGIVVGGTEASYDPHQAAGRAFGKTNVVPGRVVVDGDLRFLTDEQKEMAQSTMRNIARQNLPGTRAVLTVRDRYPAMAPTAGNERLFRLYDAVSRDLGMGALSRVDPGARGAADISFAAPYADALAGLGPVGGAAHSEEEWLDLPSLGHATRRAALLIYRLSQQDMP